MRASKDSIPTRQSLLARLKSTENNESWREFFETYWNLIYSMAVRSGLSDAEAQDVVQETIICVAKSMPNFEYDPRIGSFKAWLRKLTRWRILDQVRRRGSLANELDLDRLDSIPDESDQSFDTGWDDEWKRAILEAAASRTKEKVSEKQYQIFDLLTLRGWTTEKVVTALRTNRASLYVSNHRVRKIFEQELKALDIEASL